MPSKIPLPTGQELEILKVVWALGQASVREVHGELSKTRTVAYTTVMTMMNILKVKGHVRRRMVNRAYVYTARDTRENVLSRIVKDFIGRVFDGSAEPLLMRLIDDEYVSPKEIREVCRIKEGGRS